MHRAADAGNHVGKGLGDPVGQFTCVRHSAFARGVAFDDAKLGIDWHLTLEALQLSDKDKAHPDLSDALDLFE